MTHWAAAMFSVLFEVNPRDDKWDEYLGLAKMLRPELEQIEGFVDNVRYKSLTRGGWILSLSNWRDEKSLVRWRTRARHHEVQMRGREEILSDYNLRVGQVTHDTNLPAGHKLTEQRLDETEMGRGTTALLVDAHDESDSSGTVDAERLATSLGLDRTAPGLTSWDVFDAVLNPGDLILLLTWHDNAAAGSFRRSITADRPARVRQIRIVRDYGKYDRRESPQYYPDIVRSK